jgi:hypothetical protein
MRAAAAIVLWHCPLLLEGAFSDVDFGDDDDHENHHEPGTTGDLIIPSSGSDAWQEALEAGRNVSESIDPKKDSSSGTSSGDPLNGVVASPHNASTLIYTCGGTAGPLGFCQFPITTLAGNTYTESCADKVEDNPDYTVDRPWCFTSAAQWGFCDCQAAFSFAYVTTGNTKIVNHRDIRIEVSVNYPGTVWCSLSSDSKTLPSLAQLKNNTSSFAGGFTDVTPDLIIANIDAFVTFSVADTFIKSHTHLACQALLPGLQTQPSPIGVKLGASGSATNGGTESPFPTSSVPFLVTTTSGALMYSVLIAMILAAFIGTRTALDYRNKLLRLAKISTRDPLSPK